MCYNGCNWKYHLFRDKKGQQYVYIYLYRQDKQPVRGSYPDAPCSLPDCRGVDINAKRSCILQGAEKAYYSEKLNLLKRIGGNKLVDAWTRDQTGRLAKGKIHCSCWMCRCKSYDCLSNRDMQKHESALQQLKDEDYVNIEK